MKIKNFLTPQEQNNLKGQQRVEKNRRGEDRIKVILFSGQEWTFQESGEGLFLDEKTIDFCVHSYIEGKKIIFESEKYERKINNFQIQELIKHLKKVVYAKGQELCFYAKRQYCIKYNVTGMTSWIYHNGFSYKKSKGILEKLNFLKQEAFIHFYKDFYKLTLEKAVILFIESVLPTVKTKASCERIYIGQNKLITATKFQTWLNIMGFLNLEKIKININFHDTINNQAMEQYFQKLKKTYPKTPKIHLILNQSFFNATQYTKKVGAKMNIILHHLLPYGLNVSLIERLRKIMNEQYQNNRFFKTAQSFRKDVFYFFEVIWQNPLFR